MSQTLANISITEEVGEKVDGNNATVSSATRGKQKSYELDCIYETVEEAEAVLKLEKIWSKTKPHDTKAGRKLFYRCNKVTTRNPIQCDAGVCILLHAENTQCSIYRTYCKYYFYTFIL